jgi:hypothetical protein
MVKSISFLTLLTISILIPYNSNGCDTEIEFFPIYNPKGVFSIEHHAYTLVPVIDHLIPINKNDELEVKLVSILDTLSHSYFNDLALVLIKIDTSSRFKIAHINLRENPDYNGPGSLGFYQSWYDFFQGSSGGQHTSIILEENVLQRLYKGAWIDAVVFYYQGEEIGEMDHLDLSGQINRY